MGAFNIVLRLLGCLVGAVALLKLASIGFNIEFKPFFETFLNELSDYIERLILLPLLQLGLEWTFERLRGFGFLIPDLQEHWRQVFTLTWLLFASYARNFPGNIVLLLLGAGLVALVAAAGVGTAPMTSPALYTWPIVAFFVFVALLYIGYGHQIAALLVIALAAGVAIYGALVGPSTTSTAGLLTLVGWVSFMGFSTLMGGLMDSVRGFWRSPSTAMAFEIFGTMGAALGVAVVMLK